MIGWHHNKKLPDENTKSLMSVNHNNFMGIGLLFSDGTVFLFISFPVISLFFYKIGIPLPDDFTKQLIKYETIHYHTFHYRFHLLSSLLAPS